MKMNDIFKKMNKKEFSGLKSNFEEFSNIDGSEKIQEKKLFLRKFDFSRNHFD